MSSTYSKNKKELSGVKVVSASKVLRKNYKNGKFSLRKDIDILGKVDIQTPNIDCNSFGQNCFSGYSKGYGTDPNGLVNIRLFGNIILTICRRKIR